MKAFIKNLEGFEFPILSLISRSYTTRLIISSPDFFPTDYCERNFGLSNLQLSKLRNLGQLTRNTLTDLAGEKLDSPSGAYVEISGCHVDIEGHFKLFVASSIPTLISEPNFLGKLI